MASQTTKCDCPPKLICSCGSRSGSCPLFLCNPINQYHPPAGLPPLLPSQAGSRSYITAIIKRPGHTHRTETDRCPSHCAIIQHVLHEMGFQLSRRRLSQSCCGKESAACWPRAAFPRCYIEEVISSTGKPVLYKPATVGFY